MWAFTDGARDASKDISQAVLRSASNTIHPTGITYDGESVLIADQNGDAVWGFTDGARDTSKDISQAVLRSAANWIAPTGIVFKKAESTSRPYQTAHFGEVSSNTLIAQAADRVYIATTETHVDTFENNGHFIEDEQIPLFVFQTGEARRDMTVHDSYLYYLTNKRLMRIDLRKSVAPRAKTEIYPQFADMNSSIPLMEFVEGAEMIDWATDFSAPSYLTINSTYDLVIAANAVTEETTQLLKFKAKNKIGKTDFAFYLTLRVYASPQLRHIKSAVVSKSEPLNLLFLFENADTVVKKTNFSLDSDYAISNNHLEIVGVPTDTSLNIEVTATNTHGSTDASFRVEVISEAEHLSTGRGTPDIQYKLFIAGIDVSEKLLVGTGTDGRSRHNIFNILNATDTVKFNTRTVSNATFTLVNSDQHFSPYVGGNFFETHNLTAGGFQEPIELIEVETRAGQTTERVVFSGTLLEINEQIANASVQILCADISYSLRKEPLASGIAQKKQDMLMPSERESFEGVYHPERVFLPMLTEGSKAISGNQPLTIKQTTNLSEGPPQPNTDAFLNASDFRTANQFLPERPLLQFYETYHQREAAFFVRKIVESEGIFNPFLDSLNGRPVTSPFFSNKGNLALHVQNTRPTVYPQDWVYDATHKRLFVLLSNPEGHIRDRLIEYDFETQEYQTIHEFPYGKFHNNLATSDFDTFFLQGTTGQGRDGSSPSEPARKPDRTHFDPVLGGNTFISKFVRSTSTEEVFVSSQTQKVQIATHYWAGFFNAAQLYEFEGLVSSNRAGFETVGSEIYFRYVTDSKFGIAKVNASKVVTALFTENQDKYHNRQNFAFCLNGIGEVFFAYVSGGTHTEKTFLTVKKYAIDGTVSTVFTESRSLADLNSLNAAGGAYCGVKEVFVLDDTLYLIVEIQQVRYEDEDDTTNTNRYRQIFESAEAVLYAINLTGTAILSPKKKYSWTHLACRSLTGFENNLYFFENTEVANRFSPINQMAPGWDETLGENVLKAEFGGMYKLDTLIDTISHLGNLWYEDVPFRSVLTSVLPINQQLSIVVSKDNLENLLQRNSETSLKDGVLWLSFGDRLDYILPEILPGETIWETFSRIAEQTNTQFLMSHNHIEFRDNQNITAKVRAAISNTIPFKENSNTFPDSGYLLIDREIIRYTGVSNGNAFSGLTRGVLGSPQAAHSVNEKILFLDNIIQSDAVRNPYEDITIKLDTNFFYNTVTDSDIVRVSDATSVAKYGERFLRLDLGLSRHEVLWSEFITKQYLENFSNFKYIVQIKCRRANYLRVGDVISFFYADTLLMPIKIVSIQFNEKDTIIKGRSI